MSYKTYVRFLSPVGKIDSTKTLIQVDGLNLQYVEFDEETTKRLLEEASHYKVCNSRSYSYENDDYNHSERSTSYYGHQVDKLLSMSSMSYYTDEPRVDCLIINKEFVGVVLLIKEEGGNGWNNYSYNKYAILYADGKVVGSNESSYSFHGESSSREVSNHYTLHKIKE